ncbi:MAG: flagellar assembly peptidoglycan hydrolase FlgJ [Candidatus Accumulibacter sp.]|jgi:flagellar protein FlgJ|nr:flagellar assembly peptidoglycan hydrolase FlgJ [Accumulibacter sp.]
MKAENLNANHFVLDTRTTSDLRRKLKDDPQAGIKQVAQQFEGLLLQMMLKSMRDATPQDGLLDSDQSRFFTAIFDQQLAQDLSAKNAFGFAQLIERQMARGMPLDSGEALGKLQQATFEQRMASSAPSERSMGRSMPLDAATLEKLQQAAFERRMASSAPSERPTARNTPPASGEALEKLQQAAFERQTASSAAALAGTAADVSTSGRDYVDRVWPHAVEAARTLGVPPHFLVAHSALESGWGKSEIRLADGSSSYNVFGIKAGSGWSGPTVEVRTTEYVEGVAQAAREKFRVYGSYDEAFQDYARMLRGNPRFSEVLGQQDGTRFAQSLQQSGYATDPSYADKLGRIIGGTTLRQALAA